ncbi:MAG: GNAT family N-acetyltransferase [Pararhodobacter sp.]|nr:GNAT family N-acetyltransferase [Pararhodobacter sp.]
MTLRPAQPADMASILALWSRPAHSRFLPAPEPGEAEDALAEGLLWVWERQGAVAGFARLNQWSARDGNWGISHFATASPGQGDGKRFLAAILTEVFGPLQAHRLSLDSVPDNTAALKLWAGAGFVHEGTFRQCMRQPDGGWSDSHLFALLAHEYQP